MAETNKKLTAYQLMIRTRHARGEINEKIRNYSNYGDIIDGTTFGWLGMFVGAGIGAMGTIFASSVGTYSLCRRLRRRLR